MRDTLGYKCLKLEQMGHGKVQLLVLKTYFEVNFYYSKPKDSSYRYI